MTVRSRLPFLKGVLVFEATWSGTADQKALTLGFSALFWSLWISLWLPVITTVVWLVTPVYGANQLMSNQDDSLPTLALILAIGFALGAFIGLWGTVQLAFGQIAPRRKEHVSVTYDELSAVHDLADGALKDAWDHRRLVIHHDSSGHVTAIETSVPKSAETSIRGAAGAQVL